MSKHSPGPWRFEDGWVVDVNGNVVSRHMPANGPLIAAAPEMLALLRKAAGDICDQCDATGGCYHDGIRALLARIDSEP
jgi:hypothetical protein